MLNNKLYNLIEQAEASYNNGDIYKAIDEANLALEKAREQLGEYHREVAYTLNQLATYHETVGNLETAEDFYKQDILVTERAGWGENIHLAAPITDLANLYRKMKRYDEAEKLYKRATAILEEKESSNYEHAALLFNYGKSLLEQGRFPRAERLIKQSLSILETEPELMNLPVYALVLRGLADVNSCQGKIDFAIVLHIKISQLILKHEAHDNAFYRDNLSSLAGLYLSQEDYINAENIYKDDLEQIRRTRGTNHPVSGEALSDLSNIYELQKNYLAAEQFKKYSITHYLKTLGKDHIIYHQSMSELGRLYFEMERFDEAISILQTSMKNLEKYVQADANPYARSVVFLSNVYTKAGKLDMAENILINGFQLIENSKNLDVQIKVDYIYCIANLYDITERDQKAIPYYQILMQMGCKLDEEIMKRISNGKGTIMI